jgi:acylglycerol lipase
MFHHPRRPPETTVQALVRFRDTETHFPAALYLVYYYYQVIFLTIQNFFPGGPCTPGRSVSRAVLCSQVWERGPRRSPGPPTACVHRGARAKVPAAFVERSSWCLQGPRALSPLGVSNRSEIRSYRGLDGYRLHYRQWSAASPQGAPPAGAQPPAKTHIVALHGIQSHSGWYGYSSGRLAQAGYELSFLDRRGSGMNEPRRGDVDRWETWVDDVTLFLELRRAEAHARGDDVPLILLGVSWGGKLAAAVAARRPDLVDGLALLYPGLRPRIRPLPHQRVLLKLARLLGSGQKRIPIPLGDPALFTGETRWQEFIRRDPLALHEVSVAFLLANVALDEYVARQARSVRSPALLMLAGKDQIIDNVQTRALFGEFRSPAPSVIEYPAAQHTLEFEPDRDRFIDDLLQWLGRIRAGHCAAS